MIDGLPTPSVAEFEQIASGLDVPLGLGLVTFLGVVARMVGLFVLAPFFGSRMVPMQVRVALAVVMSAVIFPGTTLVPVDGFGIIIMLINQVLIGTLLGFIVALPFYAVESGGKLIDLQRGANMANMVNPASGEQSTTIGTLMITFATLLLVVSGGHLVLLDGLRESFTVLPVDADLSWFTQGDVKEATTFIAETTAAELTVAAKIAGPVLLSVLFTDMLLGIINRAAPQVNVFMFSLPMKAVIGIAAMLVALSPTVTYMTGSDGLFEKTLGPMPTNGGGDDPNATIEGTAPLSGTFGDMIEIMDNDPKDAGEDSDGTTDSASTGRSDGGGE